jgi:proline iminopeptidase
VDQPQPSVAPDTAPTREGYLPVPGGEVWYGVVGDGPGVPLLTLHGGPGFPHDYLEPLAALADERPVVFYDQLGCGRSDRPDDLALWRTERFVAELAAVRAALGLERVHLYGHSWGTMLAVDYLLTHPTGVVSAVMASPCLSIPRWIADLAVYRRALPADVQAVLDAHEAAGTTDSPAYGEASFAFYARHLCRLQPLPAPLMASMQASGTPVYLTMWGPSEFYVTGSLATYDRTDRLGELALPTLFTCGQYDEATPETTAWYASLVPGADVAIFEQSAHVPHLEEPARYLDVLRAFLRRAEEQTA